MTSPEPVARPAQKFHTVAPVLPARNLDAALAHYTLLGFETSEYEGGGYAFAKRDDVWLHLAAAPDLDRDAEGTASYLYVADADSLYDEWRTSRALGVLIPPADTDYGLREFAHIDPDGNLLRVGSWLLPGH